MDLVNLLNNSKLAWGISTIMMQFGARYVVGDLTEMQTRILGSKVVKRLIMCGMIFVATHDILIAVTLTIAIHGLLAWLFNEHSGLCVVPESVRVDIMSKKPEEAKLLYESAKKIVDEYEKSQEVSQKRESPSPRLYESPQIYEPRLYEPRLSPGLYESPSLYETRKTTNRSLRPPRLYPPLRTNIYT